MPYHLLFVVICLFGTACCGMVWKQPLANGSLVMGLKPRLDGGRREVSVTDMSVVDVRNTWIIVREEDANSFKRSVVFHTSDAGLSWKTQLATDWAHASVPHPHYLWSVHFTTAKLGWCVGSHGLIFQTTNGGANWIRKQWSSRTDFTKVRFLNADRGWILGDRGPTYAEILFTDNAGLAWKVSRIRTRAWINSIDFANEQHVWVVGEDRQAFHSTDGGITWSDRGLELLTRAKDSYSEETAFASVKFVKPHVGLIAARILGSVAKSILFKTRDGGRSWSSVEIPDAFGVQDAEFLNENEIWVIPGDLRESRLLYTPDGGETWVRISTPPSSTIEGVRFADSNHGWLIKVVSHQPLQNWIYYTADKGGTWTHRKLPTSR